MKISDAVPYLMLIASAPAILQGLQLETTELNIIWWSIFTFFLWMVMRYKKYFFTETSLPLLIKVFLGMVVFQAVHGLFLAQGYWDYKVLVRNIFIFSLPLTILIFTSPLLLRKTLHVWFLYATPAFFILLPLMNAHAVGMYWVPVMFMLLFISALPKGQQAFLLLLLSFVYVFSSLEARSAMIKYTVALLLGLSVYTGMYRFRELLQVIHKGLMILPFVLLILALTGVFNIFKLDEYAKVLSDVEVVEADDEAKKGVLTADTRTELYVENIASALKHNYFWHGHSLARGHESELFKHVDLYGRGERPSSEVSILNIFTYFGIFGVLVYFGIFYMASYKAMLYSNNKYMRVLGVFVAFRWVYAWVEDFSSFDLNYLLIWIMIGMCYSTRFRGMSNSEFRLWVRKVLWQRKLVLQ
ncbi:hypothetical protein [Pseudozobellia thermophila]|uniref:O-Antigen ligase n=1 Tax=Pseudozobellia thermophila TaxID=192903 RepID=A0A1M6KQT7_9FLAO|nr:hypothetical protein [Pseudozobellia thermophila]SHJ61309.1 hypothetical protein SAMN04488513_106162 [Pseudozobellia thermophila]